MMRIAVDIRALHNNTGVTRYLRSILEALQQIDQSNEYLLLDNKVHPASLPQKPKWTTLTSGTKLPGTLWLQLQVPAILKREKIDLFWGDQIVPLCSHRGLKKVASVYDLTFKHYPQTMSTTVRIINGTLIPASIGKADHIVTISNFIKNDLLASYGRRLQSGRVSVAYPGRPNWQVPPEYRPQTRGDHLLFVGNLEPRKNLENLIAALEMLKGRGLTVHLRLAGPSGWRNRSLHQLLERSPVARQITCLGFLTDEALQHEYLCAKAFVYPSLYEGFGIPVLEAMALDCPVITSANSSMQEVAGPGAMYCDPLDVGSIANAIAGTYAGPFDRSVYLRHAPEILERYTWERAAREVLSVFRRVVDGESQR